MFKLCECLVGGSNLVLILSMGLGLPGRPHGLYAFSSTAWGQLALAAYGTL